MTFEWDPKKSDENFARRGFDFEFAALVFASTYVEFDDTRHDYGERRVIAFGVADGIPLTVVFTDRSGGQRAVIRRIISARLSKRQERRRYAEAIEASQPPPDADADADADAGPR